MILKDTNVEKFLYRALKYNVRKMAIHKHLNMYTRVTKFKCDTCRRYIEEEERHFFSRTTRDITETLCPDCYTRARMFQWITGIFTTMIVSVLLLGLISALFF